MNYHKSIETLPIANYTKIEKTNNLSYLYDCSFLECETKQAIPEMLNVWQSITDDYNEIVSKRPTNNALLDKHYEVGRLNSEMLKIKIICRQLVMGDLQDTYFQHLLDVGYDIDRNGNIEQQAIEINRRADNYITEITSLQQEIRMLSGDGKEVSLEEMVSAIHRQMNITIDIYRTSVKQWLVYENEFLNIISKKRHEYRKN